MSFSISSKGLNVFYLTIIIVALIVLLIYSWNSVTVSTPIELGIKILDYDYFEKFPSLKKQKNLKIFNFPFRYVLNPDPCGPDVTLAVIVVTSHYNNVETRSAMRRAFSQSYLTNLGIKRYFLLGQALDNIYMTQASILHESTRFRDIIQGNFNEAYRNLTYKHIMGLKWVSDNCQIPKYVIKMDDDIVINVRKVVHLLRNISLPTNSISGYVFTNMKPIREPANKWYVSQEEYHFSTYPSFVSGWFYVTTPKIASKLVLLSHYFKYFWIDDVFVTGILARNLKIKLYNLKKYFTVYPEFLQCCIFGVKRHLDCNILVGPNGGDNNLFYEYNEAMKFCENEKCEKRDKPLNETCVAERKINLRGGNGFVENYKLH